MSAQVTCSHCGNLVPASLTFCPSCGKPIIAEEAAPQAAPQPAAAPPQPVMPPPLPANEQFMPPPMQQQAAVATVYCPNCGTAFGSDLAFCPNCGTPRGAVGAPIQVRTDTPTESKATNAMIAEIIGGLLGFLGIGHMMSGNTVLGVIVLVGWWVMIGILAGMTIVLPICVVATCPLYFGIPVASGFWARKNVRENVAIMR